MGNKQIISSLEQLKQLKQDFHFLRELNPEKTAELLITGSTMLDGLAAAPVNERKNALIDLFCRYLALTMPVLTERELKKLSTDVKSNDFQNIARKRLACYTLLVQQAEHRAQAPFRKDAINQTGIQYNNNRCYAATATGLWLYQAVNTGRDLILENFISEMNYLAEYLKTHSVSGPSDIKPQCLSKIYAIRPLKTDKTGVVADDIKAYQDPADFTHALADVYHDYYMENTVTNDKIKRLVQCTWTCDSNTQNDAIEFYGALVQHLHPAAQMNSRRRNVHSNGNAYMESVATQFPILISENQKLQTVIKDVFAIKNLLMAALSNQWLP